MVTLTDADRAIEELAAAQCGVVSRAQLTAVGITAAQLRQRLGRGQWRREAPGVFGYAGHPDTHQRRCWIALLHAGDGAVLSHRTAGMCHGMHPLDRDDEPVDLIVPRGRSRGLAGTRRFRPLVLDPSQVMEADGLAVTTPVRTILDLAQLLRFDRLAELVAHSETEGICPMVTVGAELARVRRRGLSGVRRIESVLDHLAAGDGMARSELEVLGDRVRRAAGLPEPVHEHPLPSARGRVGFVDRAWPEAMFLTEYDGRRWHTRRQQMHLDHQRDLEASAAGWHPLRLSWEQLAGDPDGTAALWQETYDRRAALVAEARRRER